MGGRTLSLTRLPDRTWSELVLLSDSVLVGECRALGLESEGLPHHQQVLHFLSLGFLLRVHGRLRVLCLLYLLL